MARCLHQEAKWAAAPTRHFLLPETTKQRATGCDGFDLTCGTLGPQMAVRGLFISIRKLATEKLASRREQLLPSKMGHVKA